jgi:hypothetical protein
MQTATETDSVGTKPTPNDIPHYSSPDIQIYPNPASGIFNISNKTGEI